MKRRDARESSAVRKVAARAVWRLNVLEYVILAVAAGLAMLAGALAALVLEAALQLPFRPTWVVASLVLFIVPALVAYRRARREDERLGAGGDLNRGERRDTHGR